MKKFLILLFFFALSSQSNASIKENIIEKGIQEAIKGKAGATPANFNRITARKILDNLDNNTKIY